MIVRPWDRDKDYDTLVKWWSDWEFGTVPKECLPPSGIVVSEDSKDICAGGLYIGALQLSLVSQNPLGTAEATEGEEHTAGRS